jgi:hypothetical protein
MTLYPATTLAISAHAAATAADAVARLVTRFRSVPSMQVRHVAAERRAAADAAWRRVGALVREAV